MKKPTKNQRIKPQAESKKIDFKGIFSKKSTAKDSNAENSDPKGATVKTPDPKSQELKNTENKKQLNETPTLIAWRYYLILIGMGLFFIVLVARAAYIQVVAPDGLIREADMRSVRVKSIQSSRGVISDRTGEELAIGVPVNAIVANPKAIFNSNGLDLNDPNKRARWEALAKALKLDPKQMIDKITRNKSRQFVYLQRQVEPVMANYVRSLKLDGVNLQEESRRFYPTGEVSAHLIGVTGIDSHGLEGVEKSYDNWLTGTEGKRIIRKGANGEVVEIISLEEKKLGKPLQLTIDQRLQSIAYTAIKQAVADFRATSGSAVLIDIKSGDILAMVNAPSYNPNNSEDLQSFRMRNRAITDSIEPGSTVKPFVVAAGLELGTIEPDTIINTGNGMFIVGGSRVRDSYGLGKASLELILQKSSNVGVAKIALGMHVRDLLGMYNSVGMGELSGIQFPGEVVGIFPDRTRWSPFEQATLAFGYGISITPLQLAHSYATLGNMGKKVSLRLIKGEPPQDPVHAISEKNARLVINMLEKVTHKGGSATKARVPGYRIGAKTGTSRKATAGGYSDQYVGLTAGIAPISNPRFALVVVINEPQGDQYYGGSVAGPVFSEIMKGALQIMNVPPDGNTAPE